MKQPTSHLSATVVAVLLLVTAGMAAGIATADLQTGRTLDQATDGTLAVQNDTAGENETVRGENLTDTGNVTIVNLGENVTLGAIEGVSPQEPTVFVGPNATTGPNVTTGPNGTQLNVSQTFILGGLTAGWEGVAPESINGTVNPMLNLTAGQLYAITWVNVDGAPHNVVIENQQGNEVAGTEVASGQGTTQTLVFRASSEGTYYCVVHPSSMRGDVQLAMNVTSG